MKLHHRIDGPEDGPPLILVNGLFADLTSWDPAMPHLAAFRVLRYDGRGQGQSPKPEGPYTLELLLGDLVALLDARDWPPSAVAGISNGGCVALALAAHSPERVTAVAAADCYDRVTPLLRLKIASWLAAHEVGGPAHRFDVATPWIWSEALLAQHPELVDFYRGKAAEQPEQAVRGLLEGALTHAIDVAAITCPALLVAGEEDLLTPPRLMRSMTDRITEARFATVAGGHASLLEHPEHWGAVIVPFLTQKQGVC